MLSLCAIAFCRGGDYSPVHAGHSPVGRISRAIQRRLGRRELCRLAFQCFPKGTRISRPAGGHILWIELPAKVDAMKLWRAALSEHISILPGTDLFRFRTLQKPHS